MENMNFDRIGDDLVQAYEEGYQKGLEENKIMADAENREFELLQKQVLEWAEEKDLLKSENVDKQFMKFIEEVFEFKTELDINYVYDIDSSISYEMKIALGGILVTLIIMSKQLNIDLVKCLEMAYDKIKHRNGKTINGFFVKSEDLEEGGNEMKYKEAIDAIRANYPPENYTRLREGLDLAIITLKKQIPEKPISKAGRHTGHYLCPTCDKMYWKDEIVPNYCQGCGQKFNLD